MQVEPAKDDYWAARDYSWLKDEFLLHFCMYVSQNKSSNEFQGELLGARLSLGRFLLASVIIIVFFVIVFLVGSELGSILFFIITLMVIGLIVFGKKYLQCSWKVKNGNMEIQSIGQTKILKIQDISNINVKITKTYFILEIFKNDKKVVFQDPLIRNINSLYQRLIELRPDLCICTLS